MKGFNQAPVTFETQERTTFITTFGSYTYMGLAMGLKSSSAFFKFVLSTQVFQGLQDLCTIYVDDLLVYGRNADELYKNMRIVLDRAKNVTFGAKKCHFCKKEVAWLGALVSSEGVRIDPERIKAILGMKPPTNVHEVRVFLGALNFVRNYLNHLSTVASCITDLTKKNKNFEWTVECQQAFAKIKVLLSRSPILGFPRKSVQFGIFANASDI